jgi:hypothetical protein
MRDPRLDLWLQERPRFLARRKRRGATVRTVRVVRVHAKIQFRQWLRGSVPADGSQQCGR